MGRGRREGNGDTGGGWVGVGGGGLGALMKV